MRTSSRNNRRWQKLALAFLVLVASVALVVLLRQGGLAPQNRLSLPEPDRNTPGGVTLMADTVRIHDIQGAAHRSPLEGAAVSDVEGIVTAVVKNGNSVTGFYMQDTQPDSDPRTSEGIFVYEPNVQVNEGDRVKVSGTVKEYVGRNRQATDLTLTEIDASAIRVTENGQPLPAPLVLGEGAYRYPSTVIDNDRFARFDPEEDGIDFWESVEGILVQVKNPRVVGESKRFTDPPSVEFVIIDDQANPGKVRTPSGGIIIAEDNYNPERITVANKLTGEAPIAKVGDKLAEPVVGVIDYSIANYKLYNTKPLQLIDGGYRPFETTIEPAADQLTIASYNIENFSRVSDLEKVKRISASLVHNLKKPDIVGVIEMQDNDGPADTGVTDARLSAQVLIDEVSRQGGPAYRYVDIAPVNNNDGGQMGGNIRVGFLYNPERVRLADRPAGNANTAVHVVTQQGVAHLSHNPGRIDPGNAAFEKSRKPLAAEFLFRGKQVIVIANHFNSKGGDSGLFGSQQPPVLTSEAQRVKIAQEVNGFVREIHAADPDANVVVLGDLNDFSFSKPILTLKEEVLVNMVEQLPAREQYTYVYDGNSQALDHILVSRHLADNAKVDIVNINSEFTEEHGRASDHDPVLVMIDLPH
ncbi:endonuclease/exonuclease/phosphatase family protein [Brevibacillus porteri]|uniref:endonuclease/exonuclease/phosphatase family protein n=1 Tax=Brevibacillus porteri TaxID=2126350 RepID=UPI003D203771